MADGNVTKHSQEPKCILSSRDLGADQGERYDHRVAVVYKSFIWMMLC
jgi:hypothetical protein